jgi:hypothetical protein
MAETLIQRTFAGGELAPALHARADQVKYLTGLRTCRNFMVLRSGGVSNRPGTRYVGECKTSSISVKLLRYVSDVVGESILIEAGVNYLRFYKNGAAVTLTGVAAYNGATAYVIGDIVASGGVNYYCTANVTGTAPPNAGFWYPMPGAILEIPTPFGTSLFAWVQSGNVITMTSGAGVVPPYELIYVGLTQWVIRPVNFAPGVVPPTGPIATPGAAGTLNYKYRVTAAAPETYEESEPSLVATAVNGAVPTQLAPNVVQWTPILNAPEYYIYCDPYGNGTFGYIGTATGAGITTFKDIGFTPDFGITPPQPRTPFASAGNYPRTAAVYQQRRFFANTINAPDAIWGSRTGFTSNFGVSSPLQDDDALVFKISGNQHNPVRHLLGLKTLIVLTDAGEWTVRGAAGVLTPSGILADQETYLGVAADVSPVVVGNSILYVQARGAVVRDLRFEQEVEGLAGRDLTLFSTHLFEGYTIDEIDFQQSPHSILWCCRSDGTLLGLTYLREQEVWGWHRHDSGASCRFEHVCVVPEAGEDVLYVLVRRTIGGVFHRYIEKLESRVIFNLAADAFFVDAGLSYSGPPVTTIAGLGHLEGQVLAILGDGAVVYNGDPAGAQAATYTVTGGAITLPAAKSTIHAGLPIRFAEIETLDLDEAGAAIRDKRKRVGQLSLIVDGTSRSFFAGPDVGHLYQYKLEPFEGTNLATPFTGQAEMGIIAQFDPKGRIFIQQRDPLPVSILGVMPVVEIGG